MHKEIPSTKPCVKDLDIRGQYILAVYRMIDRYTGDPEQVYGKIEGWDMENVNRKSNYTPVRILEGNLEKGVCSAPGYLICLTLRVWGIWGGGVRSHYVSF